MDHAAPEFAVPVVEPPGAIIRSDAGHQERWKWAN